MNYRAIFAAFVIAALPTVALAQDEPVAPDPANDDARDELPDVTSTQVQLEGVVDAELEPTDGSPTELDPNGAQALPNEEPLVVAPGTSEVIQVLVHVVEETEQGTVPLANTSVEIHSVMQPHTIVHSSEAVTDESGFVTFAVPRAADTQAVARLRLDDSNFFSEPIELNEAADAVHTEIRVVPRDEEVDPHAGHDHADHDHAGHGHGLGESTGGSGETTDDSSVLFVSNLMTIAELWENYIAFTQVWILGVDGEVGFSNIPDDEEAMGEMVPERDWLAIPMPDGASGIRVVQPQIAEVVDDIVYVPARVAPSSSPQRSGPTLIVRFSLRHDNRDELSWEQVMPFDVESSSVVVPLTSDFARHPRLDIDIDAPLCAENPPSGQMCFAEIRTGSDMPMMRQGVEVRVASGGVARMGDRVVVTTTGWPARFPWERYVAAIVGVLGLLVGLLIALSERKRTRSEAPERTAQRVAALRAQREALLQETIELERMLDEGEILESDYERVRERLQEQLAVILRRMRDAESVSQDQA